jgi:hypothetical protein
MTFVRTTVRDVQPCKRTTVPLHSKVRWHLPTVCQKELWLMCTCSWQSDVLAVWWLLLQRWIGTFKMKCAFTSLSWQMASVPRTQSKGPGLSHFFLGSDLWDRPYLLRRQSLRTSPHSSNLNKTLKRCIPGLIPQSLQLQPQVTLASLGWGHRWGECAQSHARRSVCFCNQSGGGASIRLLTWQLQSCDWGRRTVRFVRLALRVVKQNDGDFVDVILLYNLKYNCVYLYTYNKTERFLVLAVKWIDIKIIPNVVRWSIVVIVNTGHLLSISIRCITPSHFGCINMRYRTSPMNWCEQQDRLTGVLTLRVDVGIVNVNRAYSYCFYNIKAMINL